MGLWIESHANLGAHPKTRRLARLLNVSIPTAMGHLHALWHWAVQFESGGDLSRWDVDEIASGALWEGPGADFVEALKVARFVDDDGHLHDWDQYTGRLIERREKEAERLRQWRRSKRESTVHVRNADETRTNAVTVPNRTVPNQEGARAREDQQSPAGRVSRIPRKGSRTDELTGLLKAQGAPVSLTTKDRDYIEDSEVPVVQIADTYLAIFRGTFGDDWMRENLSLRLAAEKVPGYLACHGRNGHGPGEERLPAWLTEHLAKQGQA